MINKIRQEADVFADAKLEQQKVSKWNKQNPKAKPKVAEDWVVDLYKERKEVSLGLRTISPAEWRERILQYSEPLRTRLARVIWWDLFGQRRVYERWSELDEFLYGPYIPIDDDELVVALYECGYYPYDAVQRGTLAKS